MKKSAFGVSAAGLLLVIQAPAQSPALPQTYAFTATSNMMGPMTISVHRNGSKEVIELDGRGAAASGGLRLRLLYDFQAQRTYTIDLAANRCVTQQYASSYAPTMHDPIGGAGEIAAKANSLRTTGREEVNGIATRVAEAPLSEGKGKYRLWLDEKFGFPVKQAVVMGREPERVVFEIRQLSYAPSAATLFSAPADCARAGGVVTANGGSAEMSVDVNVQGQSDLAGGSTSAPTLASRTTTGSQAAPAGPAGGFVGDWEFTGRDGAGVQWRGTLTVAKLEPNSYDPAKYSNVCELGISSQNSGRGTSGPCLYDSRNRTFSFAGGEGSHRYTFTAALSPDGKSLTQGKWVDGASGNGSWSATAKQ